MDRIVTYINAHNGISGTADDASMQGLRIRYSTPSAYFDAVRAEAAGQADHDAAFRDGLVDAASQQHPRAFDGLPGGLIPFPVYRPPTAVDGGVDFFPYADNFNSWWTGACAAAVTACADGACTLVEARARN